MKGNQKSINRLTPEEEEEATAAAMEDKTRVALFNALAWIDGMKGRAGVDTENVEVGVQCLSYVCRLVICAL